MGLEPKWILGIAGISVIIGGLVGAITTDFAGMVGGAVLSFAVIFSVVYYLKIRKTARSREHDPRPETEATNGDISGLSPDMDPSRSDRDPIEVDDVISSYMKEFNIPREKAENLFDAGYTRWGDFSEAIPEDLLMVAGINPTIARRIISVVRSRK